MGIRSTMKYSREAVVPKPMTPSEMIAQAMAQSPIEQLRRLEADSVASKYRMLISEQQKLADLMNPMYDKLAENQASLLLADRVKSAKWLEDVIGKIQASDAIRDLAKSLLSEQQLAEYQAREIKASFSTIFHHRVKTSSTEVVDAPAFDYMEVPAASERSHHLAEDTLPIDYPPLKDAVEAAVHETLRKEGFKPQQMPEWVKAILVPILCALISAIIGPLLVEHHDASASVSTTQQAAHAAATPPSNLYLIASSDIYLTSGPHTTQRHVALTHQGDLVHVLKSQRGWSYVELHSQDPAIVRRGWIKTRHLRSLTVIATRIVHTTLVGDDFDSDDD